MKNANQPPPVSPRLQRARAVWRYVGDRRPPFALEPGPGEESVWDYPRPPAIDLEPEPIIVRAAGTVVAETGRALRVLETASPPTVYLPRGDVDESLLRSCPGSSTCEWKGAARYWTLEIGGRRFEAVGWSYEEPMSEFAELAGYLSFYPGHLDCSIGGERVKPQPGRFYGGWVTSKIVGPLKGEPGSEAW
jgi:uncharacterized protein (DUF427 family)